MKAVVRAPKRYTEAQYQWEVHWSSTSLSTSLAVKGCCHWKPQLSCWCRNPGASLPSRPQPPQSKRPWMLLPQRWDLKWRDCLHFFVHPLSLTIGLPMEPWRQAGPSSNRHMINEGFTGSSDRQGTATIQVWMYICMCMRAKCKAPCQGRPCSESVITWLAWCICINSTDLPAASCQSSSLSLQRVSCAVRERHNDDNHDTINTEYFLTVASSSNYILKTRAWWGSQQLIIIFDWRCWPVSWSFWSKLFSLYILFYLSSHPISKGASCLRSHNYGTDEVKMSGKLFIRLVSEHFR